MTPVVSTMRKNSLRLPLLMQIFRLKTSLPAVPVRNSEGVSMVPRKGMVRARRVIERLVAACQGRAFGLGQLARDADGHIGRKLDPHLVGTVRVVEVPEPLVEKELQLLGVPGRHGHYLPGLVAHVGPRLVELILRQGNIISRREI